MPASTKRFLLIAAMLAAFVIIVAVISMPSLQMNAPMPEESVGIEPAPMPPDAMPLDPEPDPEPVIIVGEEPVIVPGGEDFVVQRLFYGTNRVPQAADEDGPTYGAEGHQSLTLGTAEITIPKNAHEFGNIERPRSITIFTITLFEEKEDAAKHMTLLAREELSLDEFQTRAAQIARASETYEGAALVFIHGFNTSFDQAMFRGAQIAYDMRFDGPAFVYSWPSQGRLLSYVNDTEAAKSAVKPMDEFMEAVITTPGVERVHVIAHSMGNAALAELLTRSGTRLGARGKAIDQLVLAAPDLDARYFRTVFEHFTAVANNVTLYACGSDRALLASSKIRDDFPRLGDVPNGVPVIVPGIDTIDVTAVGTEIFSLNHNAFAQSRGVLTDLSQLLLTRMHPPEKRTPVLIKEDGPYWKMPK